MFALEDDYAMAILTSTVHGDWARGRSSTMRADIRYTPSSAFETFPWPADPSEGQRRSVAEAGSAVLDRRSELCRAEEYGLTGLYNLVDEGAFSDLVTLHRRLDRVVSEAYGWPADLDAAERNARLLDANREVREGTVEYRGPAASAR